MDTPNVYRWRLTRLRSVSSANYSRRHWVGFLPVALAKRAIPSPRSPFHLLAPALFRPADLGGSPGSASDEPRPTPAPADRGRSFGSDLPDGSWPSPSMALGHGPAKALVSPGPGASDGCASISCLQGARGLPGPERPLDGG